jgi:hypothetical protein
VHLHGSGDVGATIEGVNHGAGFLIFVRDGYLKFLEGYTYDEPWPDKTDVSELKYFDVERRDFSRYWTA